MDISNIFNDSIMAKRRKGDQNDPYMSYAETLTVINGKVVLTEIPNRFNKVRVTGNGVTWYEIDDGELTTNTFKVDYPEGVVFFHSSNNSKSLTFAYLGEGTHFFPAARIWTKKNGNEVVDTLQGVINTGYTRIGQMEAKLVETEKARQDTIAATTHAYEKTSDYETIVNETKKIYKPMVSTFTDIATTYPNPLVGWTTSTQDSGFEYRWDGFQWVNTGVIGAGGFDVVVSSTPPTNVNTIWLQDETVTTPYLTRVVPSATAPSDTTKIWLEI